MTDGFKVSKDLTLPPELVQWAIAFLGKRNSGKSYNAGDLAEEIVAAHIPLIVWDVMGIWWGLRTGVDKEGQPDPSKPGLPVVIIGGRHADIKLDPAKMEKIVEALIQTHTSAVIDVSQFRKGQQIQLATIFAEGVYHFADLYPAVRVVMVEEVDQVAPQKPFHEEARCLGAFEDLVKLGGNRNICFIGITQRPASYNKNLLTQSDLLIIGRTTAPQDKAAIEAWVEKHADKDSKELNQWYDSLSGLKKGEVWVWNDDEEHPLFQRTTFRKRRTFHATRSFILTKKAAELKLSDPTEFIAQFKDKFEPKPKVVEPDDRGPLHIAVQKIPIPERIRVHPETIRETTGIPPPAKLFLTNREEVAATENPSAEERLQVVTPRLVLEKISPTLQIPVDLMDTPSSLARVVTVLVNGPAPKGRDTSWTASAIKRLIGDHGWPDDGMVESVKQLLAWEILEWKESAGYFTFHRDRVQVVKRDVGVAIQ